MLGELALNEDIISISGVLPTAIKANEEQCAIICPAENGNEAAWSENDNIIAAQNLIQLINHLKKGKLLPSLQYLR